MHTYIHTYIRQILIYKNAYALIYTCTDVQTYSLRKPIHINTYIDKLSKQRLTQVDKYYKYGYL